MKHSAVSIRRHFLAGLVFATLTGSTVVAQDDWRNWGRDLGNQRHSPLTEINADNVDQLELAWRYEMPRPGVPSRPAQSTPLMVDGVLYLSFPYYRVVAVVPETGEELWDYTAPGQWDSVEHQQHWTGGSMRGLAYWGGQNGIAPQIVFGTEEGELISLNAATGIPGAHFGNDGYVNLKTEDVMNGFPNMHYGIGSGVAIYKHLVFTPVHNADETGSKGPAGDVRAWDLRTGELVWTFHTVPHPGEFGNDTWLDGSWERVSGANTWSFFTIDEERGILYMPLGSALNDFYGMDRPGDNLFANSIVAVDAMTGERLWHFQAIHHDLWDLDMPVPPILFDVEQDGEVIPAVGVMPKFPVLFIFNRVTGEPVYEIEERPVPAGNMQGEYYSPTQPFPVKPPVFGRIDFTMDDIATVTPEHTAACRERLMAYDGGRNRGAYTPPSLEGALVFPSTGGGTEFTGGTFDPELGYYIINYADTGHISTLEPVGENPDRRGYVGPPESRRRYWHIVDRLSVDGWPCWQPPWSQLVAVDVNSGEIAWKIPFGTVEGAPPGLLTGAPNSQKGGPTSTAAGILFIGGASDRMFRAYETKTGRELWSVETEQMISGSNPIVYMGENGKQYVAVAAGTTLLAYALP